MTTVQRFCLATMLLTGGTAPALAEVKMPAIFGSHMVLQQGVPVPVWGAAAGGEKVTVSFAGQTVTTDAAVDGSWSVRLTPLAASATGRTMTVTGANVLHFEDVLVGEVWICSGQSNMALPPVWTDNGAREIKAADFPRVRLLTVPAVTARTPQRTFDGALTTEAYDGRWAPCTPDVVKDFSAVGYFFGRELHRRLDTPVGLIGTYWSGTPAQAWTSHDVLAADPRLKGYLTRWTEHTARYPRLKAEYEVRAAAAKAQGKTLSVWFDPVPQDPVTSAGRPVNLFNGMIAPLIPFAIRGVVWYQGEGNAGSSRDAALYRRLFPAMITDWRSRWGEGDFPFLFVQLCAVGKRRQEPVEPSSSWAILRESQLKTLALPKTGMAVIFDTDPTGYLHPTNKKPVGERLALAALKIAYGKDVEESGPVFDAMEVRDGRVVLRFTHVGSGLVSKSGEKLTSFGVAGEDRKFVRADARIDGDTVVVSSPQVKAPAAVRYAWADNSEASLFNKAGLPATPFRTDAWELPAGIIGEDVRREAVPPQLSLYLPIPLDVPVVTEATTGVFVPAGYRAGKTVDLVVFLRGYDIKRPLAATSVSEYWNSPRHKVLKSFLFREEVNKSNKNVVLAVPPLGPFAEAGKLTENGGPQEFISGVLEGLWRSGPHAGFAERPTLRHLILAAHSGGGVPLRQISRILGDDPTFKDKLKECWGFDSIYGIKDKDADFWADWAREHGGTKVSMYYLFTQKDVGKDPKHPVGPSNLLDHREPTGTAFPALELKRLAKARALGNVRVVRETRESTLDHNEVPRAHLADLLKAAKYLDDR